MIESRHASVFFLAARTTDSTRELQPAKKRRQVTVLEPVQNSRTKKF
jgi:hypothetical protein